MAIDNHLIGMLPSTERRRFLAECEPVFLLFSQVLGEPGVSMHCVYFPVDGFISLVAPVKDHLGLEVGMVGREGMLGIQLALGVETTSLQAIVQGPGAAWRMGAAQFQAELAINMHLQRVIHRYACVLMAQLASSAACLRFHPIGPRLARWLLMSQDRAHADSFHVTHEFLAWMLGVRRVGITAAAGSLQRSGLIEYHRGNVTVLDRDGLEKAACSCYAADLQAYADLLH